MDLTFAAADEPGWASSVTLAAERPAGAPLLHGARLGLDARRFRQLLRALLRAADRAMRVTGASEPAAVDTRRSHRSASSARAGARRTQSLGLARAAISHDADAIERLADGADVDAGRMAAVTQLAIQPLLAACAARFRDQIPATWQRGYCPVCGAWPALAETRGLDRSRRLRCGRCASDWVVPVLRCPYCDESRHDELHALVPDENEHTRRVDVCETCHGYVKTFATLQSLSPRSLATMDLATVELDILAQDRGYRRPSELAYPIVVS